VNPLRRACLVKISVLENQVGFPELSRVAVFDIYECSLCAQIRVEGLASTTSWQVSPLLASAHTRFISCACVRACVRACVPLDLCRPTRTLNPQPLTLKPEADNRTTATRAQDLKDFVTP
jgi:hypothetical protein